jgi:hypothetical protein
LLLLNRVAKLSDESRLANTSLSSPRASPRTRQAQIGKEELTGVLHQLVSVAMLLCSVVVRVGGRVVVVVRGVIV